MLHECTHDGNDDIYRYELQLVMVDPLDPDAYTREFTTVYRGLDPDSEYRANQQRLSLRARQREAGHSTEGWSTVQLEGGSQGYVHEIRNLEPDMEYVSRLRAFNSLGCSEWSEEARCETLVWLEPPKVPHPSVPAAWDELGSNLGDLFREASKLPGGPKKSAWYARYT